MKNNLDINLNDDEQAFFIYQDPLHLQEIIQIKEKVFSPKSILLQIPNFGFQQPQPRESFESINLFLFLDFKDPKFNFEAKLISNSEFIIMIVTTHNKIYRYSKASGELIEIGFSIESDMISSLKKYLVAEKEPLNGDKMVVQNIFQDLNGIYPYDYLSLRESLSNEYE